jgi:calcineurin-like phosphoesterase family protein
MEPIFTSDWHIGHNGILKYRNGFSSIQEHDDILFENHMNVTSKRSITYFLGDIISDYNKLERFKTLKGTKLILLGNHDSIAVKDLLLVFDDVIPPIKKYGFWLSHHPIHPQELYNKNNIHGHTHSQVVMYKDGIPDRRYFNVSPELNRYYPVAISTIKGKNNGN